MSTLNREEFQRILTVVLDKILLYAAEPIEFHEDHYRLIPTESWQGFDEPVIHDCSLSDDIGELKKLAADPSRPCTFVDFDRFASVLRALSQMFNP